MAASDLGRTFLDTNVPVYAMDSDEPRKQAIAIRLMAEIGGLLVINSQVLGEFFWAVTRKLSSPLSTEEAREAMEVLSRLTVVPVDRELVRSAVDLTERASIAYWDALIIRSAAVAGCSRLLTEDLNHGQVIDGVRIENPFVDP